MFSTFKILVIYLIVSSRCTCIPIPNGETTTFNFKEKVNEELDPLKDDFKKIMVSVPVTLQVELGVIQGKMEKIIERAIRAETENKILIKDQGGLEKEKERSDLYRVLLGIGHRVDRLEQILSAGSDIVLEGDREKRWIKILKLETPIVKEFRDRVVKKGLDVNLFAKNVQQICQERNDRAGYGDVSLPEVLQENSIHQILKLMKIPKDQNTVITLKLLVSPLTFPQPLLNQNQNGL